jgi:hypothetical protein
MSGASRSQGWRWIVSSTAAAMLVAALAAPVSGAGGSAGRAPAASWSVVYRFPRGNSALGGVDARRVDDVWVVGGYGGAGGRLAVLHWNGRTWRGSPSWNPTHGGAWLVDVRSLAGTLAWAVGKAPNGALTVRWTGSRWIRVPAPHGGSSDAAFNAVDRVPGTRSLWAVGTTGERILIDRWTGRVWRRVRSPWLPGSRLYDVAAVSRRSAWAVGEAGGSSLILRWAAGSGWRQIPSGTFRDARLTGIDAVGDTAVAVGYRNGPLLLRWDGDRWHRLPWRWPGQTFFLGDVKQVAGVWWVVGTRYLADGRTRPFVMRNGGGRWRAVAVPQPGPFSGLSAVAPLRGSVWATGHDGEGESIRGIVMRSAASLR